MCNNETTNTEKELPSVVTFKKKYPCVLWHPCLLRRQSLPRYVKFILPKSRKIGMIIHSRSIVANCRKVLLFCLKKNYFHYSKNQIVARYCNKLRLGFTHSIVRKREIWARIKSMETTVVIVNCLEYYEYDAYYTHWLKDWLH